MLPGEGEFHTVDRARLCFDVLFQVQVEPVPSAEVGRIAGLQRNGLLGDQSSHTGEFTLAVEVVHL